MVRQGDGLAQYSMPALGLVDVGSGEQGDRKNINEALVEEGLASWSIPVEEKGEEEEDEIANLCSLLGMLKVKCRGSNNEVRKEGHSKRLISISVDLCLLRFTNQ